MATEPSSSQQSSISKEKEKLKFNVREISLEDIDTVSWVLSKAFLDDKVMNYFGNVEVSPTTRESRDGIKIYHFYKFLLKANLMNGGRISVATTTEKELSGERTKLKNGETIAGVACWYPPRKRLPVRNVPVMLRAGVWKALKGWGLKGFMRSAVEYSDLSHKTHAAAFEAYAKSHPPEKRKKPLRQEDAWYLQVVMTVKEFEGQGVLSLLIREAYEHGKKIVPAPFILEATSERSRDRYAHLGFEVEGQPRTILGVGKVDNLGLALKKKISTKGTAEGVEYWCMVNWNP